MTKDYIDGISNITLTGKKTLFLMRHTRTGSVKKMNMKIVNVAKVILSFIIIIDILLISSAVIFDIPFTSYEKILIFDIITCAILLFDFFHGFFRADDRKHYFRRNWVELMAAIPFDLICLPFIFPGYLNVVRLVRILFLIGEFFKVIGVFLRNTRLDEILAVFILIVIGSTLGLYVIDPGMNNLFDNLWFVIVSLTTVGYGDITPSSLYGKIISLILLIIGVFLFSAITGAISTYFMDNVLKEGSFHIIEVKDKLDDVNEQLLKNEQTINELKEEINELKKIIEDK